MVGITGIVWSSGNPDNEIAKLILPPQVRLYQIHKIEIRQPEFANHGKG